MANTTNDEEIIEKRPSHPIATTCLVLASLAILGAIAFQVADISSVRAKMGTREKNAVNKDPYTVLYNDNINAFKKQVKDLIDETDHPEIKAEISEKGAPALPAEAEGPKVEEAKAEPKDEEAKAEPKEEEPKAEPKEEEPKAEPKEEESKAEPKEEESKAEPKEEEAKAEPKEEEAKAEEPKTEEPKDEPKTEEKTE